MRALLLAAVLLLSCARAETARPKCTMTTDDGRPLLVEQWLETGAAVQSGVRVTSDGAVLRKTTDWKQSGTLAKADVAELTSEIRAKLFTVPKEVRSDAAGAVETWTACVDGKKHVVKLNR